MAASTSVGSTMVTSLVAARTRPEPQMAVYLGHAKAEAAIAVLLPEEASGS